MARFFVLGQLLLNWSDLTLADKDVEQRMSAWDMRKQQQADRRGDEMT